VIQEIPIQAAVLVVEILVPLAVQESSSSKSPTRTLQHSLMV
jgi:hypothetical protein